MMIVEAVTKVESHFGRNYHRCLAMDRCLEWGSRIEMVAVRHHGPKIDRSLSWMQSHVWVTAHDRHVTFLSDLFGWHVIY